MNMNSAAALAAEFLERISATAIVIKCLIACVPATQDNVVLLTGDFADPSEPVHASLIAKIDRTIDDVLASGNDAALVRAAMN